MTGTTTAGDRLLRRKRAAEMIDCSPKTMANWASATPPKGPRVTYFNGTPYYLESHIQEWIASLGASAEAA